MEKKATKQRLEILVGDVSVLPVEQGQRALQHIERGDFRDFGVLVFDPQIAAQIGLNEAIAMQQLHYWLTKAAKQSDDGKIGEFRGGRWWIYNTHEAWQKQFPFWSLPTVRRILTTLIERGVVLVEQAKGPDRSKWYSLDYDKLRGLNIAAVNGTLRYSRLPSDTFGDVQIDHMSEATTANSLNPSDTFGDVQIDHMSEGNTADNLNPSDQIDHMEVINLISPCDQNDQMHIYKESETTTETTTEIVEIAPDGADEAGERGSDLQPDSVIAARLTVQQALFGELCEVFGYDRSTLDEDDRKDIGRVASRLKQKGAQPGDIRAAYEWLRDVHGPQLGFHHFTIHALPKYFKDFLAWRKWNGPVDLSAPEWANVPIFYVHDETVQELMARARRERERLMALAVGGGA